MNFLIRLTLKKNLGMGEVTVLQKEIKIGYNDAEKKGFINFRLNRHEVFN